MPAERSWSDFSMGTINNRYSFQFPAAISADFQTVVLPGSVCKTSYAKGVQGSQAPKAIVDTQIVDFTGTSWKYGPLRFSRRDFKPRYDIQLSNDSTYLMILQESDGRIDVTPTHSLCLNLVAVYRNESPITSAKSLYTHINSLAFKPFVPFNRCKFQVLLHGYLPVLAVKNDNYVLCRYSGGMHSNFDGGKVTLWKFVTSCE
jgi:hypothetical protein